MRWLYPHPSKFLKHFPELMREFGANSFSNASAHYVDGFAGAALWLPPGVNFDAEAVGALMLRTVDEKQHADLFTIFNQMPEYHPHEPHWYLAAIGIDPSRQNQGQGAALIQHALRTCDRNHRVRLPGIFEPAQYLVLPQARLRGARHASGRRLTSAHSDVQKRALIADADRPGKGI